MVKAGRKPELIVIAGPNGSGKTSVTQKFLHHEWVEKSVQIDPCRRENVTLFVEIRLTLGDEIKMPPVGILRRGFFCSFRNPSPGTAGVNLKLQIYDYKIKKYPSMLPVGMGLKEMAAVFHISRNSMRKYVRLFQSSGKSMEELLAMTEEQLRQELGQ